MRRWLVLFIILLLPLRGLVGDAMAGQMAQQQVAAAAQEAHGHEVLQSAGPAAHDCAGHHPGQAERVDAVHTSDTAAASGAASDDCPTCASCQACSSVALASAAFAAVSQRASQPLPHVAQRAYPSAEPALAFKPPRG